VIDLIADAVEVGDAAWRIAFNSAISQVVRKTWYDFIATARDAHAEFLDICDEAQKLLDGAEGSNG